MGGDKLVLEAAAMLRSSQALTCRFFVPSLAQPFGKKKTGLSEEEEEEVKSERSTPRGKTTDYHVFISNLLTISVVPTENVRS